MKKIATIFLLIAVIIVQNPVTANAALLETSELYHVANAGTYDLFTNNVDGYSLLIDKDMSIDMSLSSVFTVLENENKRIEIYKQDISTIGKSAYVNYSNKFLNNTTDHFWEYNGQQTIGAYNVTVTSWSRSKLARVINDKNYYTCIELPYGHYVYTIFIKASAPIYTLGGYAYLVEEFAPSAIRAAAYTKTTAPVNTEKRGWNAETKAFYNTYFGAGASLTWGIFEPDTALFDFTQLDYYEDYFAYEFPILLNYTEFQNKVQHPNLRQRLDSAYERGKVLELTLQTSATEDGGNMVYDILNGEYDAFLRDYAAVVADFAHPVMFRLGNEMNGDWCPYSSYHTSKDTLMYKEFYRYIYQFFENADAQNVIWIWNPNGESFPNFKWNNELTYYPGDQYVDVIGMTAYNTGTYYSNVGETWESFDVLYDDLYTRYCTLFAQPLMITEFASASMGGSKEQWVSHMFEHIQTMEQIKVAIWWDGCDWDSEGNIARSYFMDESQELLRIFKRNLTPQPDWKDGVFA